MSWHLLMRDYPEVVDLARRSMRRLEHCTALRRLGMPAATLVVPCRIKPWEGLRWPHRCQRLASVMREGIVRPSIDTNG